MGNKSSRSSSREVVEVFRCAYCSERLSSYRIKDHEQTCNERPVNCTHCNRTFSRSRIENHQKTCNEKPTKIKAAVACMVLFLNKMMNSKDRCSVVAFNDEYRPLVSLANEETAIVALAACLNNCSNGTNLWDAVAVSVIQFTTTADKSRPWILIVLTDGDDTGSKCSLAKVSEVVNAFNSPSNNFTFVIGLGDQVNERELRKLCNGSNSIYQHASNTQALQLIFVLLAVQIVEGVQISMGSIQANGIEATYAQIERAQRVRRQPVDFLLLLDISGSMTGN